MELNIFSKKFVPMPQTTAVPQVQSNNNPFANPFLNPGATNYKNEDVSYGKNTPSASGYYAGEYNGKPNIVGKRLFLTV